MNANDETPNLFSLKNISIYIQSNVVRTLIQFRQLNRGENEQFGVLIGSQDIKKETFKIYNVTSPYNIDVASPCSFTLKDPAHQMEVDRSFSKSNGKRGYLGTWHTHPQKIPFPSQTDINDWNLCIKRNPDRQLFFVIVGTVETRIYIKVNGIYRYLEKS